MFKLLLSCIILAASFYSIPACSEPVVAGSLELKPGNATIIIEKIRAYSPQSVFIFTTFKFSIKNRSSSDIKIILMSNAVNAYDNLNQKLFHDSGSLVSSGIPLSSNRDNQEIFVNDKSKFVSLSPGQEVQSYIGVKERGGLRVVDLSGDFYQTHRPSTMTFNGTIGVINIDGSTDVRAFSFTDIPVSISMR